MPDRKWKSNLLSTSLPLEYEVARTLVTKGFAVEADYTYGRDAESGQSKDFSVDILARGSHRSLTQTLWTALLNY
jgi:hypothetical protein